MIILQTNGYKCRELPATNEPMDSIGREGRGKCFMSSATSCLSLRGGGKERKRTPFPERGRERIISLRGGKFASSYVFVLQGKFFKVAEMFSIVFRDLQINYFYR